MPTVLYVVRHGESVYNRDSIVSGQNDPDLTETGEDQARQTRQLLKDIKFNAVYSSDLQRAAKTAAIISGQAVNPDYQLKTLRERDFGSMDGQASEALLDMFAARKSEYEILSHGERWTYKNMADMESDSELASRFIEALEKIAVAEQGKTVLVGAHGGTIRTMLIGLNWASLDTLPPGAVQNAAYVRLDYDGVEFRIVETHAINKIE